MSHPIPEAQPHGDLTEVLPDVFVATGTMGLGPIKFSRNMVVIRQGSDLVIVNSMRLNDAGLAALDALGKVTDVIRIAGFHGSDDRFYKGRYDAKVWALKGQTYFKGVDPKKGQIYFTPDELIDEDSALPINDASLYVFQTQPTEGILRIGAGGGTLISGDSLQNWAKADQYFNFAARWGMWWMGFIKPYALGKGWTGTCKPNPLKLEGVLRLGFENLLPGHGEVVLGGAREKYLPAIQDYASKHS